MRAERFAGEPMLARLTIEEVNEVQAVWMRQWAAARRRRLFAEARDATAAANAAARREAFTSPPATYNPAWKPYQGERKPHPEGHRPYKPADPPKRNRLR